MIGKDIAKQIEKLLLNVCREYFHNNTPDLSFPEKIDLSLQVTREAKHGDLTSNIAMRLASYGKTSPAVIGEGVIAAFKEKIKGHL